MSDPDIGTNGHVSFTLHGQNADKFHLDPKTGKTAIYCFILQPFSGLMC